MKDYFVRIKNRLAVLSFRTIVHSGICVINFFSMMIFSRDVFKWDGKEPKEKEE